MTTIAIVSDAHVVHKYHDAYDKSKEFDRFVKKVLEQEPEVIIALGDMVDEKFTDQGRPISYPEGAKAQFPFVETVNKSNIPWYVLLGNHDDRDIFKTIEQSCGKLKVYATDPSKIGTPGAADCERPLVFDGVAFWFVPESTMWSEKRKMEVLHEFFATKARYLKAKKHVLLLHSDVVRRGEKGLSKQNVDTISKQFDLTLCGHEHEYAKVLNKPNVLCVPASFPTGVKKNSNPARKYKHSRSGLAVQQDWEEPFGFVMLDTVTLKSNFIEFNPSACTVEVEYDITDKETNQVKEDWKVILDSVKRDVIDSAKYSLVLVMPIIVGKMELLTKITLSNDLDQVVNTYQSLFVTEPRYEKAVIIGQSLEEDVQSPDLSQEAVFDRVKEQIDSVVALLREKGVVIDERKVVAAIEVMADSKETFFEKKGNKTQKDLSVSITKKLLPFFKEHFNMSMKEADIVNIIDNAENE